MRPFVVGLVATLLAVPAAGAEVPAPPRQAELLHLLRHDCGSCHGMRLTGGLGPPLVPARLAQLPREYLKATVFYGRPGTPMPPWQEILSESEIDWLVDVLQRGIPDAR